MDELTDDELIRMYREGHPHAFDTLFDRYYASVYAFARAMLNGSPGADDVLQETFLAVARTARDYTPRGRFRAWIMRIARNLCLNRLRRETRRRSASLGAPLVPEPVSSVPEPPEQAEADEYMRALRRAVIRLPERQREAIALYAFEGMSYRQIAETLEAPLGTVKTLIHRARAELTRRMESYEEL